MPNILRRKISVIYSLLFLIATIAFFSVGVMSRKNNNAVSQTQTPPPSFNSNPATNYRMDEYKYAKPLLLSDEQQSESMQDLKGEVSGMIESKKSSGELLSAAVHVMNLNDNSWFAINADERFNPGSLFKVPVMMAYLRESEKKPGLLDKKLTLPGFVSIPVQTFNGKSIEKDKPYTIRELLYYMIVESDNGATALLNKNADLNEFNNFFRTIGVSTEKRYDNDFSFSVVEYSRFLRILYNASYLTNEDADYALSLLVQTKFRDGMLKYLPPDIKVAHKFGESGDPKPGGVKQLHESGILYLPDGPVLLNIMTKGKDVHVLAGSIADISKLIYERLSVRKL
jgi:beta-lactamase class A